MLLHHSCAPNHESSLKCGAWFCILVPQIFVGLSAEDRVSRITPLHKNRTKLFDLSKRFNQDMRLIEITQLMHGDG